MIPFSCVLRIWCSRPQHKIQRNKVQGHVTITDQDYAMFIYTSLGEGAGITIPICNMIVTITMQSG